MRTELRPAIRVEGVSKVYRIGTGEEAPDTVVGFVLGWLRRPLRNLRYLRSLARFRELAREVTAKEELAPEADWRVQRAREEEETARTGVLWSLRGVTATVPHGEVTGLVGGNGAGKSTLLKLISRISQPSRGRISIWGRVASLLEAGTGFHSDLTGRENVYLKGAIMGMTRAEIEARFEEIVEFAGVKRFIDTPVKRYSSGMRMRLAFSVAAHLEPEILLVDEVLTVGDRHYQERCAEKLREVTREGRTALVVSHDLALVRSLCRRGILLRSGRVAREGEIGGVVQGYMDSISPSGAALWEEGADDAAKRDSKEYALGVYFTRVAVVDSEGGVLKEHPWDVPYFVEVSYCCTAALPKSVFYVEVVNEGMETVLCMQDVGVDEEESPVRPLGMSHYRVAVPVPLLTPGSYRVSVAIRTPTSYTVNAIISYVCPFVLVGEEEVDGVLGATGEWEVEVLG
jgi:lipopolysaccharide transport system ATP-binding protein